MEGCTLVTADGGLLELRPGDPAVAATIDAARVSIGLLGVFASLSFRIEPLFNLAVEERPARDAEWLENWPQWLEETDFLRLLWLPHTGRGFLIKGWHYEGEPPFAAQAAPGWHRHRRAASAKLYGATLRAPALTPLANRLLASGFFSSTVRRLGSLYDTTVTKSRGNPLELAEWTVPFAAFNACFAEFKSQLGRRGSGAWAHIPMDVRFIRSSGAWLANSHGADTVTVGCVSRTPENADSWEAFRLIERIFLDHGGRPHWAKRFAAGAPTLEKLYPRWNEFLALRRRLDPTGKFLNPWLAERFR
jgi:L-gulonolactone oxidase